MWRNTGKNYFQDLRYLLPFFCNKNRRCYTVFSAGFLHPKRSMSGQTFRRKLLIHVDLILHTQTLQAYITLPSPVSRSPHPNPFTAVTKFLVVVQLLMGEIPPRSLFRRPRRCFRISESLPPSAFFFLFFSGGCVPGWCCGGLTSSVFFWRGLRNPVLLDSNGRGLLFLSHQNVFHRIL